MTHTIKTQRGGQPCPPAAPVWSPCGSGRSNQFQLGSGTGEAGCRLGRAPVTRSLGILGPRQERRTRLSPLAKLNWRACGGGRLHCSLRGRAAPPHPCSPEPRTCQPPWRHCAEECCQPAASVGPALPSRMTLALLSFHIRSGELILICLLQS